MFHHSKVNEKQSTKHPCWKTTLSFWRGQVHKLQSKWGTFDAVLLLEPALFRHLLGYVGSSQVFFGVATNEGLRYIPPLPPPPTNIPAFCVNSKGWCQSHTISLADLVQYHTSRWYDHHTAYVIAVCVLCIVVPGLISTNTLVDVAFWCSLQGLKARHCHSEGSQPSQALRPGHREIQESTCLRINVRVSKLMNWSHPQSLTESLQNLPFWKERSLPTGIFQWGMSNFSGASFV